MGSVNWLLLVFQCADSLTFVVLVISPILLLLREDLCDPFVFSSKLEDLCDLKTC